MFRPQQPQQHAPVYISAGRGFGGRAQDAGRYIGRTYKRIRENDSDSGCCGTSGNLLTVIFRSVLFVLYLSLSITALAYAFKSGGSCMVRQTYTPTSMDQFGGSSMFTSMGVISRPPPSPLVAGGGWGRPTYAPRISDLAAFPVMVSRATRDAAFLMVKRASGAPPGAEGASFAYGTHEAPDVAFSSTPGAEGRLASALARRNITGLESDGASVPNLARCIRIVDSDRPRLEMFEELLVNAAASAHGMGACIMSGQHRMVDVSSHHKASIVPFSSTNVMYMCMAVLWVAASFCLFSLQEAIRVFVSPEEGPKVPSSVADSMVVVCFAWNVGLIVISAVGVSDERVPINNSLISAAMAVVSIAMHAMHVQWETMFTEALLENQTVEGPREDTLRENDGATELAHMSSAWLAADPEPFRRRVIKKIRRAGNYIKGRALAVSRNTLADSGLTSAEYAITTPVFITALVAALSPSSTTPIILMVYISALGFTMACGAVDRFVIVARASRLSSEFSTILVPFLILASLYPGAMVITLMQYDRSFTTGEATQAIFYLLAVTHGLTMLAFPIFAGIRSWIVISGPLVKDGDFLYVKGLKEATAITHSCINVVQKLGATATLIFVYTSAMFPQQTCTLWPHPAGAM